MLDVTFRLCMTIQYWNLPLAYYVHVFYIRVFLSVSSKYSSLTSLFTCFLFNMLVPHKNKTFVQEKQDIRTSKQDIRNPNTTFVKINGHLDNGVTSHEYMNVKVSPVIRIHQELLLLLLLNHI